MSKKQCSLCNRKRQRLWGKWTCWETLAVTMPLIDHPSHVMFLSRKKKKSMWTCCFRLEDISLVIWEVLSVLLKGGETEQPLRAKISWRQESSVHLTDKKYPLEEMVKEACSIGFIAHVRQDGNREDCDISFLLPTVHHHTLAVWLTLFYTFPHDSNVGLSRYLTTQVQPICKPSSWMNWTRGVLVLRVLPSSPRCKSTCFCFIVCFNDYEQDQRGHLVNISVISKQAVI